MPTYSDPPEPRGSSERPPAPPKGRLVVSYPHVRQQALDAASRVASGLPSALISDPDNAARRTISIAVIFESFLIHGHRPEDR